MDFSDGTSLTVSLDDWDPTNFSFKFEYHSAFDANGNVIPLDANDYDPNDPVNGNVGGYYANAGVSYSIYDENGNLLPHFTPAQCYETDCGFENGTYYCKLTEVAGTCLTY